MFEKYAYQKMVVSLSYTGNKYHSLSLSIVPVGLLRPSCCWRPYCCWRSYCWSPALTNISCCWRPCCFYRNFSFTGFSGIVGIPNTLSCYRLYCCRCPWCCWRLSYCRPPFWCWPFCCWYSCYCWRTCCYPRSCHWWWARRFCRPCYPKVGESSDWSVFRYWFDIRPF